MKTEFRVILAAGITGLAMLVLWALVIGVKILLSFVAMPLVTVALGAIVFALVYSLLPGKN